ncbi:hypothetical protein FRC12_007219 [Ceratobasidium sp. 428]|nr:hypothetical protein FRC12_007219 [Ceratobasidium sp. 428]
MSLPGPTTTSPQLGAMASPRGSTLKLGSTQRRLDFDQASKDLTGPIVDWCMSLSCTKIKEIRLYKSYGPSPIRFFVVIVSEYGSIYRLQRHCIADLAMRRWQDTIERVSLADLSSQCLITVTFTPDYYTDFTLVLAICRGISRLSEPAQVAFANDESFAYGLLCNVVRHSLRPKIMAHTKDETKLETLWKDVYNFVYGREYGFRERFIADRTQTIVQRLLRTATKESAKHYLENAGGGDYTTNGHQRWHGLRPLLAAARLVNSRNGTRPGTLNGIKLGSRGGVINGLTS